MKRYFLLLLLQLSTSQLFGDWKDKLIYGLCAIPLVVDLGSKIQLHRKKQVEWYNWDNQINTQVASGLTTGLFYFGLLYGIKNKLIPGNHNIHSVLTSVALLTIPVIINPLAKYTECNHEGTVYLSHILRGFITGGISASLAQLYEITKK